MTGRGAQHKAAERVRLALAPQLGERARAEARVPDPRKPVIPVPRASGCLGQRCRRRRDDRARRGVRQRFQNNRGPASRGLVATFERHRSRPFAPPCDRVLQLLVELARRGLDQTLVGDALGRAVRHRQSDAIADAQRDVCGQVMVLVLAEVAVTPHDERVIATDHAPQPMAVATHPGPNLSVVEPGGDAELELDGAPDALDNAQDLAPGMALVGVVDDEQIGDPGLSSRTGHGRLEHEGVLDVAARVPSTPRRRSASASSGRHDRDRGSGRTCWRRRTAAGSTTQSTPGGRSEQRSDNRRSDRNRRSGEPDPPRSPGGTTRNADPFMPVSKRP